MATLLLIEDSQPQRARIRAALAAGALFDRVIEAHDGLAGLKLLLAEPVDVVLCDVDVPGLDGAKLLQVKASRAGDVPLLFLSGSASRRRRARLLEAGASDVIAEPFDAAELVARLRLHLKIRRLQSELREKNEMLSRMSSTDALTELRTRRYADEMLQVEVLRARRYGSPLSVSMVDVDHFKRVNDAYGHPAGDAVLRGVAALLRGGLRRTDLAARYGGEELLIVMPHQTARGAGLMAGRFREQVERARFETADSTISGVTVSIGVAGFGSAQVRAAELVAAADAALYRAKQAGRNRVEIAD